jgi:hypothetical protein
VWWREHPWSHGPEVPYIACLGAGLQGVATIHFKERKRVRRIFNTLADPVETVAPWIAERLIASEDNGAHITRLTKSRLAWKLFLAPLRQRDLFSEVP